MSKTKLSVTLVFVVCLLCVFCCGSAMAEQTDGGVSYTEAPVYLDGLLSCRGYEINGDTYVPLETVAGLIGYDTTADFNSETNTLTVKVADIEISVSAGQEYMTANGRCLYLPDGYVSIDGTAVFPLDIVAKIFNLDVACDTESNTYDLSTVNKSILASADEFYNGDDLYWMSRIITAEAGNQCLEGQIAVGNVVLNRVASPRYANTVQSVIFQAGQFDPVRSGAVYCNPFDQCVVAAKLALEGYNVVGNALYFQQSRYGDMSNYGSYVMNIGAHYFFA